MIINNHFKFRGFMKFKIYPKEKVYFAIICTISCLFYLGFAAVLSSLGLQKAIGISIFAIGMCAIVLISLNLIAGIMLIGHLRGNAIKINDRQFPEIYEILKRNSDRLELKKAPEMYLLQSGGILNAFATKFSGRNYIVLYSDVLSAAYQEGIHAVEFIISHELGHIKRNHLGKFNSLFLLPARIIPFLGHAYSRACEYTCDSIGYSLCPEGAEKGILILAAGKDLYKKVNTQELLNNIAYEDGFVMWVVELLMTHPCLVKRIEELDRLRRQDLLAKTLDGEKSYIQSTNETAQAIDSFAKYKPVSDKNKQDNILN